MEESVQQQLFILEGWAEGKLHPEVALTAWPSEAVTPVSAAWMKAVMMRPFPCHLDALTGLRAACEHGSWRAATRGPEEVVRRICLMTLCARSADALGTGDLERHTASVEHPAFVDGGPRWFEHGEGILLLTVMHGGHLDNGIRTQLTWRDHAASTLAWAAGWHDEDPLREYGCERLFAELPSSPEDIERRVASCRIRPLEELREALARAREGLDPNGGAGSMTHGMALERVKALRWLTEPWWPELALTPWREVGHGFEGVITHEEFERRSRQAELNLVR